MARLSPCLWIPKERAVFPDRSGINKRSVPCLIGRYVPLRILSHENHHKKDCKQDTTFADSTVFEMMCNIPNRTSVNLYVWMIARNNII